MPRTSSESVATTIVACAKAISDHLVFYLLQSTRFTGQPAIEPALSAKALVEGLDFSERGAFLRTGTTRRSHVPPAVQARAAALVTALDSSSSDPRLAYFRELVGVTVPEKRERKARLLDEYLRVMRFVYQKEFVAQPSAGGAEAVAALYRTRGFSTDTAVEAGFLVYHGLGVVKSLDPVRRVRRVLVIGPGLDLAPRTALLESGAPESYQPWAVIDALLALGLARGDDLDVVAADINPRVVQHLRRSRASPPTLTLVSEIAGSEQVTLTESSVTTLRSSAEPSGGSRRLTRSRTDTCASHCRSARRRHAPCAPRGSTSSPSAWRGPPSISSLRRMSCPTSTIRR